MSSALLISADPQSDAGRFGHHIRQTLALAGPIALSLLAEMAMGLISTVMLGGLGDAALAAGGLASNLFFTVLIVCQAMLSGVGVLAAGADGAGRHEAVPPIYWTGIGDRVLPVGAPHRPAQRAGPLAARARCVGLAHSGYRDLSTRAALGCACGYRGRRHDAAIPARGRPATGAALGDALRRRAACAVQPGADPWRFRLRWLRAGGIGGRNVADAVGALHRHVGRAARAKTLSPFRGPGAAFAGGDAPAARNRRAGRRHDGGRSRFFLREPRSWQARWGRQCWQRI